MPNRCRIDAESTPEVGRARRIRGWGSGGSVPNKSLTKLECKAFLSLGPWSLRPQNRAAAATTAAVVAASFLRLLSPNPQNR